MAEPILSNNKLTINEDTDLGRYSYTGVDAKSGKSTELEFEIGYKFDNKTITINEGPVHGETGHWEESGAEVVYSVAKLQVDDFSESFLVQGLNLVIRVLDEDNRLINTQTKTINRVSWKESYGTDGTWNGLYCETTDGSEYTI